MVWVRDMCGQAASDSRIVSGLDDTKLAAVEVKILVREPEAAMYVQQPPYKGC